MNGHAALNRFYRLVWSEVTQAWCAVSEITRSRGKGGRSKQAVMGALTSVVLGGMGTLVHAQQAPPAVTQLPTGGVVAQGVASISQTATAQAAAMAINQSSQRAVLNWNSFNVGQNASVTFNQPNAQAVTLNRIADQNPSQIYGQISANGQVYLTNPNGIYFSPTAQVNVGALVATTHSINDADFMAGNMVFSRNGATGSVVNEGQINAALGGYIALLAPEVRNSGVVVAQAGTVALAAGEVITLNFGGGGSNGNSGLAGLTITPATLETLIENQQAVCAPGGLVILSAQSVASLQSGLVNNTGTVEATRLSAVDGVIRLEASQAVVQTGTLRAPSIAVTTNNLIDAGTWDASAAGNGAVNGGSIQVAASGSVEQTQAAQWNADGHTGGSIRIESQSSAYLSGSLSAKGTDGNGTNGNGTSGTGGVGGDIALTAPSLGVAGATFNADGDAGGGRIRIGGGWQGNDGSLANADTTTVSASSLHANALNNGQGGTVVVWSDSQTQYAGSIEAKGGANGGHGGQVEVSSHETLQQQGAVDVSAAHGSAGSVLFDPKNIQIVASVGGPSVLSLTDSVAANRYLGVTSLTELTTTSNGVTTSLNRIMVISATDSTVASSAGSIRIFDSSTGALVSSLTGSSTNDKVGSGTAVTNLGNGNYLVMSPLWGSGTTGTAASALGAVTWINGTTGVSGAVSGSNSLVGNAAGDDVGSISATTLGTGVTVLTNGNYLVRSALWGSGSANSAASAKGAVTWGSGTSGVSGVVSGSNSLVGNAAGDKVGSISTSATSLGTGVTVLSNGNYLVLSGLWGSGSANSAASALGAVTWGSGTSGVSGVVSGSNSLVGNAAGDDVGSLSGTGLGNGVTVLSNGNYVVRSGLWGSGSANSTTTAFGAVTWGSGTSGVSGVVSGSNSLVGSNAGDQVGGSGLTMLSNGNYVVASGLWLGGTGAVTWSSGTAGVTGVVSSSNSLVGRATKDYVGLLVGSVLELSNGNYVVDSPYWGSANGTVATSVGAVTWGSGTSGVRGVVSSSNSLVGNNLGDNVGRGTNGSIGVMTLNNGNYVVTSSYWGSGSGASTTVAFGAVTWGSGTAGVTGVVSSSNSLVGSTAGDRVGQDMTGSTGVTALSNNGNYVVVSPSWSSYTGAVTWGSGTVGVKGVISSSNSLVGSIAGDQVGSLAATALSNGNYVVASPSWSGSRGAVTWGSGTAGVTGAVSSGNSLVGSTVQDAVGSGSYGVTALSNGNYLVLSANWNAGAYNSMTTAFGAVTWGSGTAGVKGVVSSSNSLVGYAAGDDVGRNNGVTQLSNGNYLVLSAWWGSGSANSAASAKGAVTWGSGTSGVRGVVSSSNSLVGYAAGDDVGSLSATSLGTGVTVLSNGNYLVLSALWGSGSANSAASAKGAVTWGSGTSGVSGVVSGSNSLVGSNPGDDVGSLSATSLGTGVNVTVLGNGNYLVLSALWGSGSANSAASAKGAVTWGSGTSGVSGVVSGSNSLVGNAAGDDVGSISATSLGTGVTVLSNGNYLVRSGLWGSGSANSAAAALGAVTWGSGTSGVSGVVSGSNSLVGNAAGDDVGSISVTSLGGGVTTTLSNGNYLVRSALWGSGSANSAASALGAVTWGSGTSGVSGVVSSSNSLVGYAAGDDVGSISTNATSLGTGVTVLTNGNYVVRSALWNSGSANSAASALGAVTWGSGTSGVSGVVSSSNSLVGSNPGDDVGSTSATSLGGGVTQLTNGNYVVRSALWNRGSANSAASALGAVTWGSGTSGVSGVVSSSNSLVGDQAGDQVGVTSVTPLSNGNYVVDSALWRGGTGTTTTLQNAAALGAVTWGSGTSGVTGVVSGSNSLVGSNPGDDVGRTVTGASVTALTGGDYLVRSSYWGSGTVNTTTSAFGAVTWGSGTAGVSGVVSGSNSLLGTTAGDDVGSGAVIALLDGRAVVASPNWTQPASGSTAAVSKAGRVDIIGATLSGSPSTTTSAVGFSTNGSGTSYLLASDIASLLNGGTPVTLQASNDITVVAAITSTGSGALTLDAGRSVLLNANISLNNANLTVIGNEWVTAAGGVGGGVIDAQRDSGAAVITQASSTSLSTGTGNISLLLRGADASGNKTNQTTGAISLQSVSGNNVTVQDNGTTSGSNVSLGTVNATGSLTVAASNGTVALNANLSGAGIAVTASSLTEASGVAVTSTGGNNLSLTADSMSLSGTFTGTGNLTLQTMTSGATIGLGSGSGTLTLAAGLFSGSSRVFTDGFGTITIGNASAGNIAVGGSVTLTDSATLLTAGNITLNSGASITDSQASGTLALAAGGNFVNNAGASALSASGSSGRWVVYSADPSLDTFGSLVSGNLPTWGQTYATLAPASVASGNDYVFAITPTVVVTGTNGSKTYGDTMSAATLAGLISYGGTAFASYGGAYTTPTVASVFSTVPTLSTSASAATASVAGGPYAETLTAGTAVAGYSVSYGSTGTVTVNAKALTVSGTTVADKVYDGTTTATLSGGSLSGIVNGDTVTLTQAGSFASQNAGTGVSVTASDSLAGASASNYSLTQPTGLSANITPKTVTLSASKTYDGTTGLTGDVTMGGLVGSEMLTYSGATASDAHVATSGKYISAITLANGTNGGLASNYQLPTLNATNAAVTITPKTLTASLSNTGVTKPYDGTTSAPSGFTPAYNVSGFISGDTTAAITNTGAAYNSKDVSTANQITLSGLALTGVTGSNSSLVSDYALSSTSASTTANIQQAPLTIASNASTKVFGQTYTLGTSGFTTTGLGSGDSIGSITLTATGGTAALDNVGVYTVTPSNASGSQFNASNYAVTYQSGALTVTPLAVSLTGTKNYDGSTVLNLSSTGSTLSVGNAVAGAPVTVTGNATLAAAAAGNESIAQFSGLTLSNPNYTLQNAQGAVNVVGVTQINVQTLTTSEVLSLVSAQLASLTSSQIASFSATQLQVFTPAQLSTLSSGQLSGMSASQFNALSATQLQGLSPTQLSVLSAQQLSGLSDGQIASLSNAQFQALSPAQVSGLSAQQLSGLSPSQVAMLSASGDLSAAQVSQLLPAQLSAVTPAQIGQLSATQVANLSVSQMQALTGDQIAALSPAVMGALPAQVLAALSPADVATLSVAQLQGLSPAQVSGLTSQQIAGFNASQIAVLSAAGGLSTAQVSQLSPAQLSAVTPAQLSQLSTGDLASLSTGQLQLLTGAQLNAMSGAQLAVINTVAPLSFAQISALSPSLVSALPPQTLAMWSPSQFQSLTPQQVAGLGLQQLGALGSAQIASFTGAQLNAMGSAQIAALGTLSAAQIDELSPSLVSALPIQAFAALTAADVAGFNTAQLQALMPEQIGALTATQMAGLTTQQMTELSGFQLRGLSSSQFASLTSDQLAALTPTQLLLLTPAQRAVLEPTQTNTTASKLEALATAEVMAKPADSPSPVPSVAVAVPPPQENTEQVASQAVTLSQPSSTTTNGTLAVAVLGAPQSQNVGVQFEQGTKETILRLTRTDIVLDASEVKFNGVPQSFFVTTPDGRFIEFKGALVGGYLVILAPSDDARQLATQALPTVMASAIVTLGEHKQIVMSKLDGVVLDLR